MRTTTIRNLIITAVAAGAFASAVPSLASTAATLATDPRDGGLVLAWDAVDGAAAYTVSRAGQPVATVTGTTHQVTGLVNGDPSGYEVHTTVDGVSRLVGSVVAAASDVTAPELQGTLRLSPLGGGGVNVSYSVTSRSPDTVAYRFEVDGELLARLPATKLQGEIHITGLADGVVRYVEMLAEDVAGNVSIGAGSPRVRISTADIRIPAVPVGLRVDVCSSEVGLSWTVFGGLSGEAGTKWDVYRDGTRLARVDTPRYTDTRTPNSIPAVYEVRAVRPGNRVSLPSHTATVTNPVGPGSRCLIRYEADSVDLTGTAHGLASVVEGAAGGAAMTIDPDETVAGAAIYVDGTLARTDGMSPNHYAILTSTTFAPRPDGTLPTIEIALFDTWGRRGVKQTVNPATTTTVPVAAPHSLTATSTTDGVTLNWAATGASRYLVTADGRTVAETTGTTANLAAIGLDQAVTYRVIALDGAARSPASNPLRITGWDL